VIRPVCPSSVGWADLGPYRPREQTGRRPALTTNVDRAHLVGTALIESIDGRPPKTSVALAFQMRAVPKACLADRIRALTDIELAELELATDEALGRAEPE